MSLLPSACPLDCPDSCSLEVQVEDGRIRSLDGSRVNPVTQGTICAKVRRFPAALYGEDRMLRPGLRTGNKGEGSFREASWDEALAAVAARLAQVRDVDGGEAILPVSYGGSNGYLSQDTLDARLFWRLGASNLARTVCAAATGRAALGLYGKMPGVAFPDYVHARLIVVWGANPAVSGIHLLPFVQEAKEHGAKVVVIDPRRTKMARRADLHLAPRPGTDLPLALALVRWLFDHGAADLAFLNEHATGVDELRARAERWDVDRAAATCAIAPREIETLAELYAATSPAVIRVGWGLERNRNGGSAVAAVLALPAVAGKFGVRGGGYTLSNKGAWTQSATAAAAATPPPTRTVNMNRLGEVLTAGDPPVKLLFVYNCNPLVTLPVQEKVRAGLGREDLFTVVFDPFLTDTARYADVILPATTFLERWEIHPSYGSYLLQSAGPVIAPVGEARTNHDVFRDLLHRLDLSRPGDPESEDEVVAAIFGSVGAEGPGPRPGDVLLPPFGDHPVQFVDVFPRTAGGKVHLVPAELDAEAPKGLYTYTDDPASSAYPLALVSPASDRSISSSLYQLHGELVPLDIHLADAAARGIRSDDVVRVVNALGEVRCRARLTPDIRPGVVALPKGLWLRHTLSGTTANALVPDSLTDLGGGACFNDARVQVERVE